MLFPSARICDMGSTSMSTIVVSATGLSRAEGAQSRVRNAGNFRLLQVRAALYDKFVDFAVDNVGRHEQLSSDRFKKHAGETVAKDGKTVIKSFGYESAKMRMFRAAVIDGGNAMQVLNMAILPRPEYDLPIFCADFFSTSARSIFVLDLNPLYSVESNKSYKEKYYKSLLPLAKKHIELLPWGEKLTGESLQFFSPIVLWTKPESSEDVYEAIYLAFQDYLLAWIKLSNDAVKETNAASITQTKQAQHRYLTWRATKDPGRSLLTKLLGEHQCEQYISEFLFNGLDTLGTKSFTDYFPEYKCADGTINTARSIIGKSYSKRPWDETGTFLYNSQ